MPKQSKISAPKSAPKSSPGNAAPVNERERPSKYYCTRCTRGFKTQKSNFPASQSPIYRENDGYLTVCRHCIDEMYQHYKIVLGDEKAAIRRVCLKFDIYWSEAAYEMLNKTSTASSRVLSYISKSNLIQFLGKTFDDTLDEEAKAERAITYIPQGGETDTDQGEPTIPSEVVEFWGVGFAPSFYMELERRFKYWCGDSDRETMDVSDCAVIRQICMLEVTVARDAAAGKPIDKNINALNTLLGSANLKPVQKKKDEGLDATAETTPFSIWIRKIENTRPIAEPDPALRDVDGIAKYVSVWFLGHLCKMLKINNTYSRLYEEEMSKLRVARPEYEGEDEEVIFEDIFERAESSSGSNGGDAYGQ